MWKSPRIDALDSLFVASWASNPTSIRIVLIARVTVSRLLRLARWSLSLLTLLWSLLTGLTRRIWLSRLARLTRLPTL